MRPTDKKIEQLVALARANARKGRKRPRGLILIALGVVAAGLALMVWLNWPEPDPVPLMVIAADNVTVRGAPAVLRAWVRPVQDKDERAPLEGHELFFLDSRLAGPGANKPGDRFRETAVTGEDGGAEVEWIPSDEPPPEVVVRFPGNRFPSYDVARIFVWPSDSKILVVEVRHGMMAVDAKTFAKKHVSQIKALSGVPEALEEARSKGYRIVYLAVFLDGPEGYRKLRAWLQQRSVNGKAIVPEGPALGRASYRGESDGNEAGEKILRELKGRFKGAMTLVVGRARDAEALAREGVKTLLIAEKGAAPAGAKRLGGWRDLGKALP